MRISVRSMAAVAVFGGVVLLAGCGSKGASWSPAGSPGPGKGPVAVAITAPADGAPDVPTSTEIALGAGREGVAVTITDSAGNPVEGAMRPDGTTWLPATQLKYSTSYTATVKAAGRPDAKTTFTTMAKPGKTINVSTAMGDDEVYGVAMPIIVNFGSSVAKDQRANIERRLLVTSDPPQVGSWHWFSDEEIHYRPKEYWQEGTKISARLATGGLQMTGTAYGAKDVTIRASIGEKVEMTIEDSTHTMTVAKGGAVVKTLPISLGKASTPSSSGHMVVMTKNQSELFKSDTPGDSYSTTVYWTQRLTTGGEYIHAAPWSVDDQGKRNVSHGCTNVSNENAKWLYGLTHVGDPVTVSGTPRRVEWGNGWTDWDRPWEEYVKGSALPAGSTDVLTTK